VDDHRKATLSWRQNLHESIFLNSKFLNSCRISGAASITEYSEFEPEATIQINLIVHNVVVVILPTYQILFIHHIIAQKSEE